MKKAILASVLVCALPALVVAQSPREQLSRMVESLAASPGDTKLRQDIIVLYRQVKPPPAVPDPARAALERGTSLLKGASGRDGYERARAAFTEAARHAPWWADAYHSLSVAHEALGEYSRAVSALNFYLLASPAGTNTAQASSRLASLQGKPDRTAFNFEGFWRQEEFQHFESKQWMNKNAAPDSTNTIVHRVRGSGSALRICSAQEPKDDDSCYERVRVADQAMEWFNPGLPEDCSTPRCGIQQECRAIGPRQMECLFVATGFKDIPTGVRQLQRYRKYDRCVRLGYEKEEVHALRCD